MIGTVDPVSVVSKLRKKNWPADIISVGPAKESEKQEESKKEEPKKDKAKKEEPKKEAKKEEVKKDDKKAEPEVVVGPVMPYKAYYPPMNTYHYMHHSMEENPNACVIC